mmetsp:Transcript_33322/g.94830  ORF Transcript_33322/g.94830 Transcript_33322/m.94830 type:complete len:210 (+) Transcript_33322:419-1048(+)
MVPASGLGQDRRGRAPGSGQLRPGRQSDAADGAGRVQTRLPAGLRRALLLLRAARLLRLELDRQGLGRRGEPRLRGAELDRLRDALGHGILLGRDLLLRVLVQLLLLRGDRAVQAAAALGVLQPGRASLSAWVRARAYPKHTDSVLGGSFGRRLIFCSGAPAAPMARCGAALFQGARPRACHRERRRTACACVPAHARAIVRRLSGDVV